MAAAVVGWSIINYLVGAVVVEEGILWGADLREVIKNGGVWELEMGIRNC